MTLIRHTPFDQYVTMRSYCQIFVTEPGWNWCGRGPNTWVFKSSKVKRGQKHKRSSK